MTVYEILQKVMNIVKERGVERDLKEGERSMKRCVLAFNALTGKELTESQGWLFMLVLKLSRASTGNFSLDHRLDTIGYAALLTECELKENK